MTDYRLEWIKDKVTEYFGLNSGRYFDAMLEANDGELEDQMNSLLDDEIPDVDSERRLFYVYKIKYERLVDVEIQVMERVPIVPLTDAHVKSKKKKSISGFEDLDKKKKHKKKKSSSAMFKAGVNDDLDEYEEDEFERETQVRGDGEEGGMSMAWTEESMVQGMTETENRNLSSVSGTVSPIRSGSSISPVADTETYAEFEEDGEGEEEEAEEDDKKKKKGNKGKKGKKDKEKKRTSNLKREKSVKYSIPQAVEAEFEYVPVTVIHILIIF